jgi:uncharacterized lipoprotein YmbA
MRTFLIRLSLLLAVLTTTFGCRTFQPVTDNTRHFILTAAAETATAEPAAGAVRLGLASIQLPAYLEPQSIAWRTGQNEIRYLENERWAEPLEEGILRVIGRELSRAPEIGTVHFQLWSRRTVDLVLRIRVHQFEASEGGKVVLDADYQLTSPDGETIHVARDVRLERNGPSPQTAPAEAVNAMSALLSEFTAAVAAGLTEIPAP